MKCTLNVLILACGTACCTTRGLGDGFSVEPGIVDKPPSLMFSTTGTLVDVVTTFTVLAPETSGAVTSRSDTQISAVQIDLPAVKEDTHIEVAQTTNSGATQPFVWRTVARPAGKPLIQYAGRKEMLPPADFEDYWARAKKDLAAVPLKPVVTRVPDRDTSTGLLFRVELSSVQDATIVCWFYVPRDAYPDGIDFSNPKKKFPAIVITPGYGAEEPPIDRTKSAYITLSVNPRNHGPSRAYWKSPVEHLIYNIMDAENYYYKLAFLDCLRAVQFLFTREEVDGKRIATEGGSQGGLFAIATAALEPRIACVCANIPAFCDYPDGMLLAFKGGHTTMRDLLAEGDSTATLVRKSLCYVDGVNMISRVRCPVQINMGDLDPVCPYVCGIVLHNRLPKGVPRELHVAPDCRHAVPPVMRDWNAAWYKRWLTQ